MKKKYETELNEANSKMDIVTKEINHNIRLLENEIQIKKSIFLILKIIHKLTFNTFVFKSSNFNISQDSLRDIIKHNNVEIAKHER